jgi:hypothetical protein
MLAVAVIHVVKIMSKRKELFSSITLVILSSNLPNIFGWIACNNQAVP